MDILKNTQLLSHDGRTVDSEEALKDKSLILYYFSASWCEHCLPLLQMLHKVYDENRKRKFGLEIVYVSSDTEPESFLEYFKKHHGNWYAIPFSDSSLAWNLRLMYHVTNIPAITVIHKDGTIVSTSGKQELEEHGINVLVKWTP